MLEAVDLFKAFGGVQACRKISFGVKEKEIVGLIGPNGSGKTTVLNILSGFHRPDYGRVLYKGHDLVGRSASYIARSGVCRTWQDPRVIRNLSARENIELGALAKGAKTSSLEATNRLISQFQLREYLEVPTGELPYGVQKLVALARTVAASPSLLLLDEPLAGLSETEVEWVIGFLQAFGRESSVLIVDHAFGTITRMCDRIIVLNSGQKVVEGVPDEVRAHPTVVDVYLGRSTALADHKKTNIVTRQDGTPRLAVADVASGYGQKRVISGIDMEVKEGQSIAILGVNGAGKTTFLRALVGLLPLHQGTVRFEGTNVASEPAVNARGGLILVPEGAHAFQNLSVRENLAMGGFVLGGSTDLATRMECALQIFPWLRERLDQDAGVLSGGERQMLAIARALMLAPRVLLLDEPFLGLAPIAISEVAMQLQTIREESGCAIVIAEQHVSATLQTVDKALIMIQGQIQDRIDDTTVSGAEARVMRALLD